MVSLKNLLFSVMLVFAAVQVALCWQLPVDERLWVRGVDLDAAINNLQSRLAQVQLTSELIAVHEPSRYTVLLTDNFITVFLSSFPCLKQPESVRTPAHPNNSSRSCSPLVDSVSVATSSHLDT